MCSATDQRGGKITKSAMATPGRTDGAVRTVKMDGSCQQSMIKIQVKNMAVSGTQKNSYRMIK